MQKFMTSKFSSYCAETGKTIKKGEAIFYNGKAYCQTSKTFQDAKEQASTSDMVQANEDAYFDNFCYRNNI